jgi:hypothetical protein
LRASQCSSRPVHMEFEVGEKKWHWDRFFSVYFGFP